MTTRLALYNAALLILGERKLASLSEAREPRRALDDAYDDGVAYCLEAGFWNFAMRAVQIGHDLIVTPSFGYSYAFIRPTDIVRTFQFGSTATFDPPLMDIVDEQNYWYANVDPIYVKYVSNDVTYGMDLAQWSESFSDYVANRLAVKTCRRITGKSPDEEMMREEKKAQAIARSKDAMDEPTRFPPRGTWVRSRTGNWTDRSNTR